MVLLLLCTSSATPTATRLIKQQTKYTKPCCRHRQFDCYFINLNVTLIVVLLIASIFDHDTPSWHNDNNNHNNYNRLTKITSYFSFHHHYSCTALQLPFLSKQPPPKYDYDLVVIGAGASGLYGAGTAASVGYRTLLIDKIEESKATVLHDDDDDDNTKDRDSASSSNNVNSRDLNTFHVGGDCTNAACVPSKALRAAARLASYQSIHPPTITTTTTDDEQQQQRQRRSPSAMLRMARTHTNNVISLVRQRESTEGIARASPNLNVCFAERTSFTSSHRLTLSGCYNASDDGVISGSSSSDDGSGTNNSTSEPILAARRQENVTVTGRKFLIATGAGPIIPQHFEEGARLAGLPLLTYRTLLRSSDTDNNSGGGGRGRRSIDEDILWNCLDDDDDDTVGSMKQVVVVGGGSTACELAQALARLGRRSSSSPPSSSRGLNITIVAPALLPSEDVTARIAAGEILQNDGVTVLLQTRALSIKPNTKTTTAHRNHTASILLSTNSHIPADILLLAIGRSPEQNLTPLALPNAHIAFTPHSGITTNSYLRSITAPHVYASGDCASAIPPEDRRAHHAGWTGFHAVRNALVPVFFLRSKAVHEFVPRVTFMDPEVASVGMGRVECVRRFGDGGFEYMMVGEEGMDRTDQDSILSRGAVSSSESHSSSSSSSSSSSGFVELRVHKHTGRILGATACSPSAAEIINEIGLALQSKTTVETLARALHAYPSHGYLLYRIAVAMATGSISGLLAACGPVGRGLSAVGKFGARVWGWRKVVRVGRGKKRREREWQALGADRILYDDDDIGGGRGCSFLEAVNRQEVSSRVREYVNSSTFTFEDTMYCKSQCDYVKWLDDMP